MIRKGWEITIFIIIFISCGLILLSPILRWKATLPINRGMTAEEVIFETYPQLEKYECEYEYYAKWDYLFVFTETFDKFEKKYNYQFDIGYKNRNSGYILKLPGMTFGEIYDYKVGVITLDNKEVISFEIRRYFKTDYVIIFKERNAKGAEFFVNDKPMDRITFKKHNQTRWVYVTNNISQNFKIYAIYKDQVIDLIDASQIRNAFEEAGNGFFN